MTYLTTRALSIDDRSLANTKCKRSPTVCSRIIVNSRQIIQRSNDSLAVTFE